MYDSVDVDIQATEVIMGDLRDVLANLEYNKFKYQGIAMAKVLEAMGVVEELKYYLTKED